MIFELQQKKDKELQEMYGKAMRELDLFYKLNWKRNTPNIIIVKTRKEIDQLRGCKTERWLIGWAERRNFYILDKKTFEKESNHKYSKTTYYKLIKHELSHLFFGILVNAKNWDQFNWFDEGVAGYLSEQYKNFPKPQKLKTFLDQYSTWKGDAHHESSYAIKLLSEKFGEQKLLKLIKSLSKVGSEKDFNNLFKEIYRSKPTYPFFNKLLTNSK